MPIVRFRSCCRQILMLLLYDELGKTMWQYGFAPDETGLKGPRDFDTLTDKAGMGTYGDRSSMELVNMLTLAKLVTEGALLRKESRVVTTALIAPVPSGTSWGAGFFKGGNRRNLRPFGRVAYERFLAGPKAAGFSMRISARETYQCLLFQFTCAQRVVYCPRPGDSCWNSLAQRIYALLGVQR